MDVKIGNDIWRVVEIDARKIQQGDFVSRGSRKLRNLILHGEGKADEINWRLELDNAVLTLSTPERDYERYQVTFEVASPSGNRYRYALPANACFLWHLAATED